ncbi:hypothetical protein ACJIZ3_015166 [Penstemon smallii]|uniref:Phosphatidate cytidylyltransferase n=1 Tax=Penstemon smallii TaxID=265156 RepID=A0ABD3RLY2_9LAMI
MNAFSSNYSMILRDIFAAAFSFTICGSIVSLVHQKHIAGLLDEHMGRKLIHIGIGSVLMHFWPMFSSGRLGAVLAGLVPIALFAHQLIILRNGEKIMKMLRSRFKNYRDLMKATVGYGSTIFLATAFYWRTSPIGIAAICNLCAGDGVADIVGRRFGSWKLPYNKNKSFAGTIAMTIAGFLASIWYMYYFSWFGYIQDCSNKISSLFLISLVSALVESHPLSTQFDDNLTVPLVVILVGTFVL